jgi:uncharacterized protein (DUF2267 family)
MSRATPDPFNHALHTANIWLADICSAFGTRDRRYTQRVLRTWLHALRDRLTVDAATKFAAQLPELLRGVYYDGWEPNKVPVKYGVDQYVQRFAAQAGIPSVQVPTTAATITEVIADHMSPGQLAETLAELPADLRATITGATAPRVGTAAAPTTTPAPPPTRDRVARLEDEISSLTEAVRALAHGLEGGQLTGSGIDQIQVARAARLADEILIAAGTRPTP